jgi:hypothetical protein
MHILSFVKVFAVPELKAILKRIWLLIFLLLIVVAALWSIGFSKGTLAFLKAKMDNPFIKFVSVTIPHNFNDENSYKQDLNRQEIKQQFGFKNFNPYPTRYVNFKGINDKEPPAYLRMINIDDEVYKFIMNGSDMLINPNPVSLKDAKWSCIVTEVYLKKLGYKDFNNISFLNYIIPQLGDTDTCVPIPVAAIVKQLPENLDLFVGEELFYSMRGDYQDNPLDISKENHFSYVSAFIHTDEDKETIEKNLNKLGFNDFLVSKEKPTFMNGFVIKNGVTTNAFHDYSKLKTNLSQYNPIRCYDFDVVALPSAKPEIDPDKLVINFASLDSVRSFQTYLFEKHKLKIDLNTVEAKENFNFFDKISSILSIVLSSFSILLIIYVITSMMFDHIEKNKKNLGTLKAFGLSNYSITIVYSIISLVVISSIFIIGFIIAQLIGNYASNYVLLLSQISIANGMAIFLLNIDFKLLFWFIIFPLLSTTAFLIIKLRNKTPGDLIYERD